MQRSIFGLAVLGLIAIGACSDERLLDPRSGCDPQTAKPEPSASNNLSFPVIWSEGVAKTLPEPPTGLDYLLAGEWWYWWGMEGTDPDIVPLSCPPDPDDMLLCDDGIPGQTNGSAPGEGWVRAYLQKDALNAWQASSFDWSSSPVSVDRIDWGDNLESVAWNTRSQVRTEVVLFQDLATPGTEYGMRHVSGWGINEVHGVAATGEPPVPELGPGVEATVYSHCARLTIQRLLVNRGDPQLSDLVWVPGEGWAPADGGDDIINPPIFNMAVYEGGDGPGYYSAEINVKGRIIYGYTWNVRRLNDGAGDYRLTFSFDENCGGVTLNTFFTDGITELILPVEVLLEEPGGGGTPALDYANNLTYIDITINDKSGGGGGGGGGGRGGGGH